MWSLASASIRTVSLSGSRRNRSMACSALRRTEHRHRRERAGATRSRACVLASISACVLACLRLLVLACFASSAAASRPGPAAVFARRPS